MGCASRRGGASNRSRDSWAYVAGGTTLLATAIGVGLAVAAGNEDPGDAPSTGPDVTMDDLQDRADAAHSLAIGADVSFGIAAGALATTVALALVSAHGVGSEDDSASGHAVTFGPLGGRWTYRF